MTSFLDFCLFLCLLLKYSIALQYEFYMQSTVNIKQHSSSIHAIAEI